jgi:hypothetical protein
MKVAIYHLVVSLKKKKKSLFDEKERRRGEKHIKVRERTPCILLKVIFINAFSIVIYSIKYSFYFLY